jgi:hypothetical protein
MLSTAGLSPKSIAQVCPLQQISPETPAVRSSHARLSTVKERQGGPFLAGNTRALAIDDNGVLTDAANWILSRSHAGHRQDRNERRNQSKLFHFLGPFFVCLEGNVPHDLRKLVDNGHSAAEPKPACNRSQHKPPSGRQCRRTSNTGYERAAEIASLAFVAAPMWCNWLASIRFKPFSRALLKLGRISLTGACITPLLRLYPVKSR